MQRTKATMDEKDIPRQWYNLAADLPAGLQAKTERLREGRRGSA